MSQNKTFDWLLARCIIYMYVALFEMLFFIFDAQMLVEAGSYWFCGSFSLLWSFQEFYITEQFSAVDLYHPRFSVSVKG